MVYTHEGTEYLANGTNAWPKVSGLFDPYRPPDGTVTDRPFRAVGTSDSQVDVFNGSKLTVMVPAGDPAPAKGALVLRNFQGVTGGDMDNHYWKLVSCSSSSPSSRSSSSSSSIGSGSSSSCVCDPDVSTYRIRVYDYDDVTLATDIEVDGSLCDGGGRFDNATDGSYLRWNGTGWAGDVWIPDWSEPHLHNTLAPFFIADPYFGSTDRCSPVGTYMCLAKFANLRLEITLP